MIKVISKGNFNKTEEMLKRSGNWSNKIDLNKYGLEGVAALKNATPKETGLTANSWTYNIERSKNSVTISFENTNINDGVPIAIILQYGHGTRNGGWVEGYDYINPAVRPIFDELAKAAWKEVTGK